MVDKTRILEALSRVNPPHSEQNIVEGGMVSSIVIKQDNSIGFAIEIDPDLITREEAERLRQSCERAARSVEGVSKVTAVLTSSTGSSMATSAPPTPAARPRPYETAVQKPLPGIRHIIAVASGKGGVGKSTVATNIAVTLGAMGYKTGLVDTDVLGPSIARMMGIHTKPEIAENQMVPIEKHGIKCLSMGMLMDEDTAMVWRGPMVSKAISQLMFGSRWGTLDFMVVDLPPGTGDVHLTICKNIRISGVVLVSTPQQVALMDVKKAIGMFRKLDVPLLGIVENMSYFSEPGSNKKHYVYGKDNVKKTAKEQGLPMLGEIPILPEISAASDDGAALCAKGSTHEASDIYRAITKIVLARIEERPKI